ncbi:bifunctional protein-serine/threonine kinase/phosphatase [Photobacterium gaetbulicola]|uniref:bifunctional protein-serine/threonine kinase/phosphatase n=1 Tax=Photobacterium gaetbulicola TaxID=1295392 RepID=UPI0009DE8A95|nr:bifunctional protein-serine/threonine kinase/phosphatase [Photobacterium gaetbulicola]
MSETTGREGISHQKADRGAWASRASTLKLDVGGYSVGGCKPSNQDAFAICQPMQRDELVHKGVVACLADGVSCSEQGQRASQISVSQFIEEYYATPKTWGVKHSAGQVLHALNQWLYSQSNQSELQHNGLVTTFCAVIIKSNTAYIMHVGDTRAYLYRNQILTPLTQDHRRQLYGQQAFLTRSLGMDSHIEVDFQQTRLEQADRLLLVTDGIHEWLGDADMQQILSSSVLPAEQQARVLVEAALASGSQDNVSGVLLEAQSLPSLTMDEYIEELTGRVIPPVLEEGNRIDQYRILRVLHSGPRSHVYLAVSEFDTKRYVLKMPSLNFAEDYQYLQGFVREGWLGEQIANHRVMKIHPFSRHSPFLYHVCDWIEGKTLRQWMDDNPRPELGKVRLMAEEIIKSLRVLQRHRLIHRDIKPENLIVNQLDEIVIIDFGSVYSEHFDEIYTPIEETIPVGDIKYLSPECLSGGKLSVRSDMYSVSIIIYEMLTGHFPYSFPKAIASSAAISRWPEYIPLGSYRRDLPFWLDLVLRKGCFPQANLRYAAFSELASDLFHPSAEIMKQASGRSLKSKNPVRFWKVVSLCLFFIVIVQLTISLD